MFSRDFHFLYSRIYCTMGCFHCTEYIVRCTMYSVHCTMNRINNIKCNVYCIVYNVQYILYAVHNVQCTLYIVQCKLYAVYCTLCTVYNEHCTPYTPLIHSNQCTGRPRWWKDIAGNTSKPYLAQNLLLEYFPSLLLDYWLLIDVYVRMKSCGNPSCRSCINHV